MVPPGFPIPADAGDGHRHGEEFPFLFVGADFERKGGFDLVEAFELLPSEHPEARLDLAGSDPSERNPDRLAQLGGRRRRERVLARLDRLVRAGAVRVHGPVDIEAVRGRCIPLRTPS